MKGDRDLEIISTVEGILLGYWLLIDVFFYGYFVFLYNFLIVGI